MSKRDGKVTMPFGVMGGAVSGPTGHARFVSNTHRISGWTRRPRSMRHAPRFFRKGTLKVERGYSDAVRAQLSDYGPTRFAIPRHWQSAVRRAIFKAQ